MIPDTNPERYKNHRFPPTSPRMPSGSTSAAPSTTAMSRKEVVASFMSRRVEYEALKGRSLIQNTVCIRLKPLLIWSLDVSMAPFEGQDPMWR